MCELIFLRMSLFDTIIEIIRGARKLPAKYYIEPKWNCVFVRHYDEYTLTDAHDQLLKLIDDSDYVKGMNILRDMRETPFPSELNYTYFKKVHPSEMEIVERQIGRCKIALLVGNRQDYGPTDHPRRHLFRPR